MIDSKLNTLNILLKKTHCNKFKCLKCSRKVRLQTLRAIQLPSEATGAVAINAFIYIINFIIIYTVFLSLLT